MNSIKSFIQNDVLLPRLRATGVLVVYDPERRYRELCLALAGDRCRVVDATESSIESREAALASLQALGTPNGPLEGLVVYVPAKKPVTDEQRQRDPFAIYGACGGIFPDGDGDEYRNLCLSARPDYATEIRRVFGQDPSPAFAVIDAVGGGSGWPTLQALLVVQSAREILLALLAPTDVQKEALKAQEAWVAEVKDLLRSSLGLQLITRGKSWSAVADELWRFLLFSEFAFDLPGGLPGGLADVPRAGAEAKPLVRDLCEWLRNDRRSQTTYVERAEAVEGELNLPALCGGVEDLGVCDTFPFEERSVLARAVDALRRENLDLVRQILGGRENSIWAAHKGESRARWQLVRSAMALVEACDDAARQLAEHAAGQAALLDFYTGGLREVDRLQREFEQGAADSVDAGGAMGDVVALGRARYRSLADAVQALFVKHLEKSGWPPAGRLANADVFDRVVAPKLQESGRRVAYFLVDALRYELGVVLEKQLAEDGKATLQAAFAQLPTVTRVGMASLLPGAGQDLRLVKREGGAAPALGDVPVATASQRMDVLRKRYGQRFAEAGLDDFVRGKYAVPAGVELLVLRSNTFDSLMEATPEAALPAIHNALRRVRVAAHKLGGLGFHDAIIATDHGFFLNPQPEAGDVCAKPPGDWVNLHERALLGEGVSDLGSFVLAAGQAGIRGDFARFAGPRAMVCYRAGEWYFHGGASLQEAVVPVIELRLRPAAAAAAGPETARAKIALDYKRGARRITTRLPVVELTMERTDLFSGDAAVEVLLEAHDRKGNVVGEAKPGGLVNPATGTILLRGIDPVQVPLKMDGEFEGKFTLKALDPATLTTYAKLELETDYPV